MHLKMYTFLRNIVVVLCLLNKPAASLLLDFPICPFAKLLESNPFISYCSSNVFYVFNQSNQVMDNYYNCFVHFEQAVLTINTFLNRSNVGGYLVPSIFTGKRHSNHFRQTIWPKFYLSIGTNQSTNTILIKPERTLHPMKCQSCKYEGFDLQSHFTLVYIGQVPLSWKIILSDVKYGLPSTKILLFANVNSSNVNSYSGSHSTSKIVQSSRYSIYLKIELGKVENMSLSTMISLDCHTFQSEGDHSASGHSYSCYGSRKSRKIVSIQGVYRRQ